MDDVDRAFADLERQYEVVVIEFVTECVALLREATPVDTGHARANWIPSKGSPFGGVDGEVKTQARASKNRGAGSYSTAGAAAAAGEASVLAYKLADGPAYIANHVPYIVGPGSLNDGHSSQRAAGWVEASVAKAIAIVSARHGLQGDFTVAVVGTMRGL